MENSTEKEFYSKTIQALLCTDRSSGKHWIFLSALNSLLSITAFLGNTLILVALYKETSLRPPSKLLYRCLAITDLLVGLISEPSTALNLAFLATEHRSTDLCFYSAALSTVSLTILSAVSLLTLSAIGVDRLLALNLGLRYRQVVTSRRLKAIVILYWIPSITFALMLFWNFAIAKSYNYTIILLCILVLTFSYSKIFLTLRHHHTQIHQHQGQPEGGEVPLNIARYRKTVTTAIWVLVALLACFLPYCIVLVIFTSHGSSPLLDIIWELTVTLVYLNASLNPILYCWRMRHIKQQVKNTVRRILCLPNVATF